MSDPAALVGQHIFVEGFGQGTVTGFVKRRFLSLKYVVRFGDGREKSLKLRRSASKGNVPFEFVSPPSPPKRVGSGSVSGLGPRSGSALSALFEEVHDCTTNDPSPTHK